MVTRANRLPPVHLHQSAFLGRGLLASQRRRQRPALHVWRDGDTGAFEERRDDVHAFHQLGRIPPRPRVSTRPSDDQRHAADAVVAGVAFAVPKVLSEPLAVVGREDDDRVVGDA